jgi:tRNA nucleotidyltransferase (CCA-adding enzyme)
MNTNQILSNVLQEISLSDKEIKDLQKKTKEIISRLKKAGLKAEIGGSLAKQTIIKKPHQDIDLFITLEKDKISKFESLVKKTKLKFETIHGSRDYIRMNSDGITFELIPVMKFKKPQDAENVTDFSLIHVKYIKNKISKNKKLADEIKLAKAFCYAQECYGAESYIGGFSGYALEVLICYYGSFMKFLKQSQTDKIIDPEKQFKNKNEITRELNQSKLQSPIILIDPTYKYRNVCAGLTNEIFQKFLSVSQAFLKNPSEEFFKKKEFHVDEFTEKAKKENLSVYRLDIKTDRQEGDIAGTKMKKFMRFLIAELKRKQQEVLYQHFDYKEGQESQALLAIKEKPEIEIIGPKTDMKEAIAQFKKVRKTIYNSKGFVCAKEKVSINDIFQKQTFQAEGMGVGFDWTKV